ncbi:hypothetical protein D3C79_656580 [compost metagenome]
MAETFQRRIGIAHISDLETTLGQVLAHDSTQIQLVIDQQQALALGHALRTLHRLGLLGYRYMAPWEDHGHLGTQARGRLDPHVAPRLADKAIHHRQTKPGATPDGLGGEEWLKGPGNIRRRHAMAIILDVQGHVVAWRQAVLIRKTGRQPLVHAAQRDIATLQACFTGIGTEVDQGIFKLGYIKVYCPRNNVQLPVQTHLCPQRPEQQRFAQAQLPIEVQRLG